jgi:two-component system, response regulator YesN
VGENMKKVLIADDELLVRIGLKQTIPWEENGFVVVGTAKNGREAIEIFEEFDPDILLTDIKMPIISGLELIQELKARKSNLRAIILSHYDDFNYAKEAIKLGASEYILKSDLCQENLISILKKLSDEIDGFNRKNSKTVIEPTKDKVIDNNNLEVLFRRIVFGEYKNKQEFDNMLNIIKTYFEKGFLVVATVKFFINDLLESNKVELKDENLIRSIENVSNQVFSENSFLKVLCFNLDEVTYLFNIDNTQSAQKSLERLKDLITLLKRNIKQILDVNAYIGLSRPSTSHEKLVELIEEARAAREYCFFEGSGIVEFNENLDSYAGECPKIHLDTIRDYFKAHDKEQLNKYITGIFDILSNLKNTSYIKEVFFDLMSYARVLAVELNLINQPAFNDEKLNYKNLEKLHNFKMTKQYITDIYDELMYHSNGNNSVKYSYVISKCLDYIKSNYDKNISLGDAAGNVQISKSYLSLLFKQETGINFSNYLTNYRIEKSKKLLLRSNYKIYELAEKVGFDNPYYFSKVFKEVTGSSCKEYRKQTHSV